MKKNYIIGIVIFLITLFVGIYIAYRILLVPFGISIDKTKYPVTGIDISGHTGNIDFNKLTKHDIDFIFFKSTEGDHFIDKKFEKNYAGLKQTNIPIGVYHFFRFNKSGKKQAEFFLTVVENKQFELPYVLDIEDWGNITTKSRTEIITEIKEFIFAVESRTNKKIIIYTNESGYNQYIKNNFNKHDIWICSFSKTPKLDKKWHFWQYAHNGKFNFANGWIDINTFNGNKNDFKKYINQLY